MQVEVVLAERLAMVGEVEHAGIDALFVLAQQVDQAGQHVVGVQQGVVVAVDDAVPRAGAEVVAGADRGELLVLPGIALEVGRTVAAHLVQDQHGVLLQPVDEGLQVAQEDLVMALAAGAQGRILALAQVLEGDAIAGALAAGLVVPPQDPQACALQHIEKAFLGARASVAVVRAAQVGEHAGTDTAVSVPQECTLEKLIRPSSAFSRGLVSRA